jgi:hypothetical protein
LATHWTTKTAGVSRWRGNTRIEEKYEANLPRSRLVK